MKHLKCLFKSPNLSRYKYKICGIKSATDRCKYNISIPVEVELKNSYGIYIVCIKTPRHPKSDLSRCSFIPDRTSTI